MKRQPFSNLPAVVLSSFTRRNLRTWAICLLLALPSVIWPLGEWIVQPKETAIFLPFLNQIDVALPLSWIHRLAEDPHVTDLTVWEYRHAPGSPMPLCSLWPSLINPFLQLCGTTAGYWVIVFFLHVLWLRFTRELTRRWFPDDGLNWIVVSLFVYGALAFGTNAFHSQWKIWEWSPMLFYENFRAFPSVIAITITTLAVWRLHAAHRQGGPFRFLLGGLCASLTVYARPFDWMILVTLVGLMGLRSLGQEDRRIRIGWALGLMAAVTGAIPFLLRYWIWSHGDTTVYAEQMARGVMEGKNPLHFVKYAVMGLGIVLLVRGWLTWSSRHAAPACDWKPQDRAFFTFLIAASFLPYFQFLPSGKTPNSYQYFYAYFSMPFAWLCLLLGAGLCFSKGMSGWWNGWKGPGTALAIALGMQSSLALTPDWMLSRIRFTRSQEALYRRLAEAHEPPVVLSPSMSSGTPQELVLRSQAWSFVPHPMMYAYGSMSPTTELVERQLLAKLLLTGTVSDLAPIFSEHGLPGYENFGRNAPTETAFWIDRLENCPARSFFFFDPIKSRKDFKIRKINIPPALLQQKESFAYFEPPFQSVFQHVRSLENLKPSEQVGEIQRRFRLTHILLTRETARFEALLARSPGVFRLILRSADGSSLWEIGAPPP